MNQRTSSFAKGLSVPIPTFPEVTFTAPAIAFTWSTTSFQAEEERVEPLLA
jgi:hypothetical protein